MLAFQVVVYCSAVTIASAGSNLHGHLKFPVTVGDLHKYKRSFPNYPLPPSIAMYCSKKLPPTLRCKRSFQNFLSHLIEVHCPVSVLLPISCAITFQSTIWFVRKGKVSLFFNIICCSSWSISPCLSHNVVPYKTLLGSEMFLIHDTACIFEEKLIRSSEQCRRNFVLRQDFIRPANI